VRNLIKEGKSNHIRNVVLTAQREGMQTLEVALSELIAHGVIDAEIGRLRSMYPGEIKMPVPIAANGEGSPAEAGSGRRSGRPR
jgi:Tfp pilus assembly pilus retraction ATPase PilT